MTNYRQAEGINYSLLKNIAENPFSVMNKPDLDDIMSVKQGNLLDARMEGEDLFATKYAFFDGVIPTATTLVLADEVINQHLKSKTRPTNEDILVTIDRINASDIEDKVWSNIKTTGIGAKEVTKDSKLIGKFDIPLFWDYVNFNLDNTDKLIIDRETFDNVNTAHDLLKTHEFTSHIFDRKQIYQEAIFFTLNLVYGNAEAQTEEKVEVDFKILPDMITLDEDKKIIYPYDFKFLNKAGPRKFWTYFFQKYYYIQSSLYTMGVKDWAAKHYPDYKVFPYQFLVVGDKDLSVPLTFNPINFITLGFEGFDRNGISYPGIKQLVQDYEWHLETGMWKHKRDLYESKGVINLML